MCDFLWLHHFYLRNKIEKGYPRFLYFEPVGQGVKPNRRKEHSREKD
jgi:hypothetical protein